MDTPARHIYTGNGNQKVFPIPTKIIGDDYIRIEIDGVYQSDRSKWDIVNNNVVFLTAPVNTANIDIQVATSEEALSVLGSTTNMDIVATNISTVLSLGTIINEIVSLESIKAKLVSLFNDKATLDSLYADKAALDALYASKTAIDSLYSIKNKLDSLYADKDTLDGLFSSKEAVDSLYSIKAKLDSIYADKSKLDSIYADKTQIDATYNNLNAILSIYNNISDINYFSDKYLGSKAVVPTTRNDGTALQEGDLYFNSVTVFMYVYTGDSWNIAYASLDSYNKTEIRNTLPNIGFDTSANITPTLAQVSWSDTEKTLSLGTLNDVVPIGQKVSVRVRNTSGSTINKGTVVMATGSVGNSGRITVSPHNGTQISGNRIVGITTENINNNAEGFVITFGKVSGINTTGSTVGETWVDGDILYVKPNDNGNLTKVTPTDTQLNMPVAFVIHSNADGILFVRVSGIDENRYITKVDDYLGSLITGVLI